MVQINVRVKDKETGNEREITYYAFRDLQYRYELIGQIDEKGNLIEGNPNLLPQHKPQVQIKSVADAGERVGLPEMESESKKEIVPHETLTEKKKPGRKPKYQTA